MCLKAFVFFSIKSGDPAGRPIFLINALIINAFLCLIYCARSKSELQIFFQRAANWII